MNNDKLSVSVILASILYSCADAQVMDIGTNHYRDYLDFAQNKGKFAPSDKPVEFQQRNGEKFTFERIPDSGARNSKGNYTSLGRNYVVTATHVEERANASNYNDQRGWFGNTRYEYLTSHTHTNTTKVYNTETTYLRTTKYIVEGNVDPLDVPNLGVSKTDRDEAEAEARKIENYLKQIKDNGGGSDDSVLAYQAGTGLLGLEKPNASDGYDGVVSTDDTDNRTLGGSLNKISTNYSIAYRKTLAGLGGRRLDGLYMMASSDKRFRNRLQVGDSGSGFFVYDTIKKKWVLVGVLSVANGETNHTSVVTKADLDDYKKDYEHLINSVNIFGHALQTNKDNILSNTSDVTLNSNLDLGHGGIVVKRGETTIKGSGRITKIAGFDVEEGASLTMNVVANTSIHKVGKGKLIVNSSGNKTLRLGQGSVELKKAGAFSDMYLASGRGTLKLGVQDNLNGRLFFGNGGGILDLNGHNQELENVAANSNAARILNSDTITKSTLNIKGAADRDTIFHANASQNMDIEHKGNGKALAFDGGFDIKGRLKLSNNAKVTLQGHPTTHALGDQSVLKNEVKKKINDAGLTPPSYMDLTRPSTLEQPDWDKRTFNALGGIDLDSSELTIGKYAEVKGEIRAKNSKITLSGEIKHYIDRHDGSNTYNESESNDALKYRQGVESGNLTVKEANFENRIVMDSDSVLRMGGTSTKLRELVINDGNLASNRTVVEGSGRFELGSLEVNSSRPLTFGTDTTIKNRLTIKNYGGQNGSLLNFQKTLTLEKDMIFGVDLQNLVANKKYELMSAQKIINKGAKFDTTQKVQGLYYKNYTIENGKLFMELKETQGTNPAVTPGANGGNQGGNQNNNQGGSNQGQNNQNHNPPQVNPGLSAAELSDQQNKVLGLLKDTPEYKRAKQNGDFGAIKRMVEKIESDMNDISKTSIDVNVKALQTGNELINSRLSHILTTRANVSRFKLAALGNDAKPTTAMVYEAAQENRNNFWANVNQAYFKDRDTGGDLKFYGTNIGYDRSYDSFILGVSAGMNQAKFGSKSINDDATIYSLGAYGFYEFGAHEFQSNLNLAFTNSKRSINGSQKVDVKSTGVLSSNYYKYGIVLDRAQTIKPVLALEFGANSIKGFKNDFYKQKDVENFNVAFGAGAEYVLNTYDNAFIAQFLVKQSVYNSADKTYVSLNNSSEYVDYKLDNSALSYKLNLTANTKITKSWGISYQLAGMLSNRSYGVSGSIKASYKF